MTNIDSIFGPTSGSHKFYQQVFNLYNGAPGAGVASPGNFNDSLGCNGWQGPDGLGTTEACAVHFFENLYHPSSESLVSGRVDWNIGANDRVFLLVQYDHGSRASHVDPINPAFNAYSQCAMVARPTQRNAYDWSLGGEPIVDCRDLHRPDFECGEPSANPSCLSDRVELVQREESPSPYWGVRVGTLPSPAVQKRPLTNYPTI